MPLSASDLLHNADAFRHSYPRWPSAEPEERAVTDEQHVTNQPPAEPSLADALKASLAAVIEFGPCRCHGCRFVPTPTHLTNGLCGMCVEDGCELAPP